MELLLGIIALLGGFGYFQYNKAKQAETDGKLANTTGQDTQLNKNLDVVKSEVSVIDERINELNKQKELQAKLRADQTAEEKASKWNK